jgi:hypothetical protein
MTWWDRLTDTEAETVGLGLMLVGIGLVFVGLFLGKDNKNYIVLTGLPLVMTGALAFGISKKNAVAKTAPSTATPAPISSPVPSPTDLVPPLYLRHISSIHKRMGVSPLCSAKAPLQPVEATQAEVDHFKQINLALEVMRKIR